MRPLELTLRQGLESLSLVLEGAQVDQLLDYVELIDKWARVYNLTALRAPQEILTHHLLDSLAAVRPLRLKLAAPIVAGQAGKISAPANMGHADIAGVPIVAGQAGKASAPALQLRLLDVGSGAGLPGVILAICCPEFAVDCVDAVSKKAAFVRQVAISLNLPNLRGLHARVQSLTDQYAIITSRAFATLVEFVAASEAALAPDGVWMAMKGRAPLDEIAALPRHIRAFHVEQLTVPMLDAQRCIVWMRKT